MLLRYDAPGEQSEPMRMTRRQLMAGLLGLGVGASLPFRLSARAADAKRAAFDPDHRRALSAACERILPGAIEAGVPAYIDHWMKRGPFDRFLQPMFKIAAVHLNRLAKQAHQKAFADCKPEQQDAILLRFEKGEINARAFHSRPFFEHLVRFVIEGFLGDPIFGGNRDQVGWAFIGRKTGKTGCWWQPRDFSIILEESRGEGLSY